MASSEFDYVFWANIVAGTTVVFYMYFMWLQYRGLLKPSPRLLRVVRWVCLFLLLLPVAARYQYSQAAILYLSAAMFVVGLLIRLKQKMGL